MEKDLSLHGESKNVEYKERVPEDSQKYMKSVVAFANGDGGRIVFGVEDGTMRVVGIPQADLFQMMDAITNAVTDSCEPMIIPDLFVREIEGKSLIILEIAPGMQRPYYLKKKGPEKELISGRLEQRVWRTGRFYRSYFWKEKISFLINSLFLISKLRNMM